MGTATLFFSVTEADLMTAFYNASRVSDMPFPSSLFSHSLHSVSSTSPIQDQNRLKMTNFECSQAKSQSQCSSPVAGIEF